MIGRSHGGNTGLQGHSGSESPPASPSNTGVFGYAAEDGSAKGVWGKSPSGRGGLFTSDVGRALTPRPHSRQRVASVDPEGLPGGQSSGIGPSRRPLRGQQAS